MGGGVQKMLCVKVGAMSPKIFQKNNLRLKYPLKSCSSIYRPTQLHTNAFVWKKHRLRDKIRTKLDAYTVFEAIVIHIKVGGVSGAADFRDVGGFARADVVPVNACEKGVLFKVVNAILAQPVFSAADQPSNEIFSLLGHICHLKWELEALLRMKELEYTWAFRSKTLSIISA